MATAKLQKNTVRSLHNGDSHIPLTTAAQNFAQYRGLVTGMTLDNWDTEVSKLDLHLFNADEGFESAMK